MGEKDNNANVDKIILDQMNRFDQNHRDVLKSLNNVTEKIGQMHVVLTKNTEIVRQHELRSTRLEGIVETMNEKFIELSKEVSSFESTMEVKIDEIEKDIQPIKEHVEEVNKTMGFLEKVPKVLKVIFVIITIFSSSIGLYTVVKEMILTKHTPTVQKQIEKK